MDVPEGEGKNWEVITAENFPKLMISNCRCRKLRKYQAGWKIRQKKCTYAYTIQIAQTTNKEKSSKIAVCILTYRERSLNILLNFLLETMLARKACGEIAKLFKELKL